MKPDTVPTPAELRRLAEERLNAHAQTAPFMPRDSRVDAKTFHELEVHQIELEMQNEELRSARSEVEALQARYFDFYDLAPVGYVIIGETGLILEANLTAASLLGVNRAVLIRQPLSQYIYKEDQDFLSQYRKQRYQTPSAAGPQTCELRLVKPDGTLSWVRLDATATEGPDGTFACRVAISDISEHKHEETRALLAKDVLTVLNRTNNIKNIIRDILLLIKEQTGIEAIGIRLKAGEDFPYAETMGFPDHFVVLENQLCTRDATGQILRNAQGLPVLECMCGNVICGRTNPTLPFFTEAGSFWTNSTTDLLVSTTEAERQALTRNRCRNEGYESVALIPLKAGDETIGLLQINDHRRNRFTVDQITFLEGLGASIGIAITRKLTDEGLRVRNAALTRFNAVMVDRELRMIELKREVNELCLKLGEPPRYKIVSVAPFPPHEPSGPL